MNVIRQPVTIKDIARKFNCSPSTVSRALNNDPSTNELTRRHIQRFAKNVGYQRNSVSLSLLNRHTNSIGIIVPYIQGYFYPALIDGIESRLEGSGYTLTICQSRESYNAETAGVEAMLANRVDGLFVALSRTTGEFSHFERVVGRGVPLILVDRDCADFQANKVLVDDYQGAFKAVEHLIQIGYKNIVHLKGSGNLSVSLHRLNGYLKALKKHDLPVHNELIVPAGFTTEGGEAAARSLLNKKIPFDAVFAANDNIAIGAMYVISKAGYRIPEDIAIVGFDNEPHSAYLNPSLTTVSQPVYELGERAARLFLEQVSRERNSTEFEKIVLPSKLIVRESSCRMAAVSSEI